MKRTNWYLVTFTLAAAVCILFAVPAIGAEAGEAGESLLNGLNGENRMAMAFAAVGAVGLSCLASAYSLAKIGSAAMGAMSEKPEIGGRALIFLGLAEGIAIYGLIVAIMILNKI